MKALLSLFPVWDLPLVRSMLFFKCARKRRNESEAFMRTEQCSVAAGQNFSTELRQLKNFCINGRGLAATFISQSDGKHFL
jgi:hypothetical protein